MRRASASLLASESLAALAPAAAPAQVPGGASADRAFLQTGGPPASVATAAQLSSRVAAAAAEPLTSRVAALRPGVLNLTSVHSELPGEAVAATGDAAGKALNITRDIKQDALGQLALVFGPGQGGSIAGDAQPLAAGAAVPAAAPVLAPAKAPLLAPAAAAPRLAPAAASNMAPAYAPVLVPAASLSTVSASVFSGGADRAYWLQRLTEARAAQARPASAGRTVSLQATKANAPSPHPAATTSLLAAAVAEVLSPQSAATANATASLEQQSKEAAVVDAKIASNWQAIMSNWGLLGRAGLATPERPRRRLLGDLVPLTSASALTHRPLTGLVARVRGTFSGLFRRAHRPAAAAGADRAAAAAVDRPARRGLAASAALGAFPPGVAPAAAPAVAPASADAMATALRGALSKALRADVAMLQSLALDPEQLQLLQSVVLEQPYQEGAAAAEASQLVRAFSVDQPGGGFSLQQVRRHLLLVHPAHFQYHDN